MAQEYQLILFGAGTGLIRNLIGYIKAKLKHHEAFHIRKFVLTVIWGGLIGAALAVYQSSSAFTFAPMETIFLVFAGIVIVDEIFQAIFLRAKGGSALAPF